MNDTTNTETIATSETMEPTKPIGSAEATTAEATTAKSAVPIQTAQPKPRVRFAPSPTGKLHVGGARTAIYNWAFARATGGTFILRIDDTDPTRSTEENTQIILRAMRWLGLDWDEGPEVGGDYGPYFQTERVDQYREAAERLVAEGKAYYCFCTPEQLEADRAAARERGDSFQGYQRTCRNLDPAEAQARVDAGEPHTIRIKVPDGRGDVVVKDAVHGEVAFNARELDDFIIFRTDGTPTYNFATVVDDAAMGITHIIRGDDHLSNTPRQVIVYEALGAPVPIFAHISMILGSDGKKLSKRHGATSVEEYRDQGYLSDAFVNYLALLGWAPDGESTVISRERLASEFSLDHVSKNPAIMDPKKLDFINAEYLHAMDDATFASDVIKPELAAAGLDDGTAHDDAWYGLAASAFKPRCTVSRDVAAQMAYLYTADDALEYDEKALKRWVNKQGVPEALAAAQEALAPISSDSWTPEAIEAALDPLPANLGMGKGKVFQPIRVACVGGSASPGIGETLALLGRDHTLARIANLAG